MFRKSAAKTFQFLEQANDESKKTQQSLYRPATKPRIVQQTATADHKGIKKSISTPGTTDQLVQQMDHSECISL
ncbi:CLUMA_CG021173, isoform A [Clunio marinus]|uniref:CLUMA_CG021173, isoform A n=1 Tax=Clunio marinus TaxID=568069 RepID=A0A1J1J9P7_9DIPT|nr:CLUMA_CG021173, isoform A [Clunio marinus]